MSREEKLPNGLVVKYLTPEEAAERRAAQPGGKYPGELTEEELEAEWRADIEREKRIMGR